MHGLQTCLFKYITVAAFGIYAQLVKMPLKGEVEGHPKNSNGNYIVDMVNHGILFFNFCGNSYILYFPEGK